MKLRRLRLENFRRFREPLVLEHFDDGINLFAAPNESGKSTIAEAIRAAFLERHRTGSLAHLQPWGDSSASPTVEIDFELGGQRYHLSKAFVGRKRCDLRIDDRVLDGAQAEDHLAALLGFAFPGKGGSQPEHRGIPGLLWIQQASSHELQAVVDHAAEHLRRSLGDPLGGLAASGGDALLQAVESARNELLTQSAGNPRGDLAKALDERTALEARCAALARDIDTYRASVDRLAALRREHERDERERPWAALRAQLEAATTRLTQAESLRGRLEAEQASLRQWTVQVATLRAQLEAFARDQQALEARGQALEAAQAALERAGAELALSERRHRDAEAAHEAAQHAGERVRQLATRHELARTEKDLADSLSAIGEALARARRERERVIALRAQAAAAVIAAATLARLRELAQRAAEAALRVDAAATTLDIDLPADRTIQLDAERIAGQARRTLLRPGTIALPDGGRITVSPGGADLERLAASRDALHRELTGLFAEVGVESLAQAEERARLAAQRLADAQAGEAIIAVLAPQGIEVLDADAQARALRLDELRASLAALPPAADDEAGLPAPAQARAVMRDAAAALAAAAEALSGAREAAVRAAAGHEAAQQERAAAQATLDDPERALRLAVARQSLDEAIARHEAVAARVAGLEAELAAARPELLRQDIRRLGASVEQLEAAHAGRRDEILRLEATLEAQSALGLEEALAGCQREGERVARRAGELARRAAALDHLLGLLRAGRDELARRLRAPLQRHLDHYLGILDPGTRVDIGEDLAPAAVVREGPRGPQRGRFEELSVGAREQVGVVARLAYADLLREAGKPTLLMLDDALVHTDEDRLGQMKRVLYEAASRHQLLIFTCHPAAWRDLGVPIRGIGTGPDPETGVWRPG